MIRCFHIDLDGINGYDHWEEYVIDDWMLTEKEMFADVRHALKELHGGHADVWEVDDNGDETLYAEIEV